MEQQAEVSKNRRHRKDKPWDTDDIDHWHIEPFRKGELPGPLTEESSFAVLFPKYREAYLREVWPAVTRVLGAHGVACELNLVEGSMAVRTTRKTWDPYIIVKARDMVKLLARSVPLPSAARVLEDGVACDVIKIGGLVGSRERFVRRRQRLVGPEGNTLKAIELLTQCFVLVQGSTVSAIGSYKGLKEVRRIAVDCMRNVHPIYHIKELMIKRELAKDERLKTESWDRFLPHFRRLNEKRRAKKAAERPKAEKKAYTPFPPEQRPRKEDLEMASGEYFLREDQREAARMRERREKQKEKKAARHEERMQAYVAPDE